MVSRYHKALRVGLLVFTAMLIFDSGFLSPVSKQLSDHAIEYVASSAIGVLASVPPNEFNQITADLTKREHELELREAALAGREISARDFGGSGTDYSTYILSVILFILTVLIVLNYALDWVRTKNLNNNYERSTT